MLESSIPESLVATSIPTVPNRLKRGSAIVSVSQTISETIATTTSTGVFPSGPDA